MKTSESIKEIAGALLDLQKRIPYLGKDSEGYGYKYTSLPAFKDKTVPVMYELGLSLSHVMDNLNGEPALTSKLVHAPSGEFYEGTFPLFKAGIGKANDAQQIGAAITYMIRYSSHAITGIASDDDDAACLTQNDLGPDPGPLPKPVMDKDLMTTDKSGIFVAPLNMMSRNQLGKVMKEYWDQLEERDQKAWQKVWDAQDQGKMIVLIEAIENRHNLTRRTVWKGAE